MCQARAKVRSLRLAQALHKVLERLTLHAGHALGADLFLVGKDADSRLGGMLHVEDGGKLGIGADAVVVAVAADEAAVKSEVAHIEAGDDLQLRGEEILLGNAVLLVEQAQHGELHALAALVGVGRGADEEIETLAP